MAIGSETGVIAVYDMSDFGLRCKLDTGLDEIYTVQLSSTGAYLLIGDWRRLRLFDCGTRRELWQWSGSYKNANFTADGRWIIIRAKDSLECWECVWSYRILGSNGDNEELRRHFRAVAFGRLGNEWQTRISDLLVNGEAAKFRDDIRQYIATVGLGIWSADELDDIMVEFSGKPRPTYPGEIVFDDFDPEGQQWLAGYLDSDQLTEIPNSVCLGRA